jgi:predicted nucleic acid-binding protein
VSWLLDSDVLSQPAKKAGNARVISWLEEHQDQCYTRAELRHQFQAAGKPMPVQDSYIAAIARRHNLTVATGNVKDFQRPGVRVFNPFAEINVT